ncbi:MAG: hypothetical protein E6R03_03785 [Hyphomicrobiaceae bacterium]|nr:MAG: hypothetical protein E6R03_03785 [Hyphomicrobiaceae bacterium]
MISSSRLQQLLLAYQKAFPQQPFDAEHLADFIVSETFEIEQQFQGMGGTTLEAALIFLNARMVEQDDEITLSSTKESTVASGLGWRALDTGGPNPIADALIRLARKVKQC